jgi:hypothetical protein
LTGGTAGPTVRDRLLGAVSAAAVLAGLVWPLRAAAPDAPRQVVWTFDRLDKIGGVTPRVEGHPTVIDTPLGKAIEFHGVDDALFIDRHPLAGADTFTFEAIFRPDGGNVEQRWFHLAEQDPKTGLDTDTRFLFELRVVETGQWYLDAFVNGPGYNRALMFRDKLHPLGTWYHVAQVYDGTMYRSYVNGELQGEAEIAFKAQGTGHASVGVRINRVNYFKGAVRQARFTPRALAVTEFMKPAATLRAAARAPKAP